MPSKTAKQAKLMRAVAHGWKPSRMKGPPVSVAKEFVAADKKAKGMQAGGLFRAHWLRKMRDPDYDPYAKYGTEPLTLKQASKLAGGKKYAEVMTAKREMTKAGWSESGGKWYPPQATLGAPTEGGLAEATAPQEPVRTIQPIEGREFISGAAPPRRVGPPARTAAEIAPGFRPGRVPPALLRYLERQQAIAAAKPQPEEPVEMQFGGMMNFLGRGRVPPMQQAAGRGQPGGGAMDFLTRGRVPQRGVGRATGQGMQKFLRRGQVPGGGRPPQPGGGGLARAAVQPGPGGGMGSDMGMQKFLRRGQVPGGGSFREAMMNRGVVGPQPRSPGPGAPPMKGIGRAPGAGVPLRGVGRPPGMGRPGAGGGVRAAVMPGRSFRPGGGGAGMPGAAPRIGMGDQQGALARATQVQTGRPPMSRRMGFPGRGGPDGGFGGRRGRRRGRMRR